MSEGADINPASSIQRTYELWQHASDILTKHSTKDYLSDVISNLNKAIGLRIKMLNETYYFDKSPFKTKDKKIYKQLEYFEIVRPKLINEIRAFRNDIEHKDQIPPSYKKCQDFLEICWYFLRATDLYIIYIKDSLLITNPVDDNYHLGFKIDFKNGWINSIHGCLEPSQISTSETLGFIKVAVEKFITRQQILDKLSPEEKKNASHYIGKNPEDIILSGQILDDKESFQILVKQYFKTIA